MTGFRVAYGGAQEVYGVRPDLTTLGKVIGGGLPVGAYGGRKDIMQLVSPQGPVYQAGTLSGNPLAMAEGIQTLRLLQHPGTYQHLNMISSRLVQGLLAIAQETGHPLQADHLGGMFGLFFSSEPVRTYQQAKDQTDSGKFAAWHREMLKRGVYLPPSRFEAGFTSLAHSPQDVDRTLHVARDVLRQLPR